MDTATGVITEDVKLTASDGIEDRAFGTSVGIDGDRFVIGAPSSNSVPVGKAYSGSVSSMTTLDAGNASRNIDGISFMSRTDWIIGETTDANLVTLGLGDTADVTMATKAIFIGKNAGSDSNTLQIDGILHSAEVYIGSLAGNADNTLQLENTAAFEATAFRLAPDNFLKIEGDFMTIDSLLTYLGSTDLQVWDGGDWQTVDNSNHANLITSSFNSGYTEVASVPEPSTAVLILGAFAAAALITRGRRNLRTPRPLNAPSLFHSHTTCPPDPKTELPRPTQLRTAVFAGAPRKAALWLFSVAILLTGGVATVCGQSALDGFDPNANAPIQVVAVQPDGKLVIVGNFTTLAPNGGATVTRNHIARLNPDGTLDAAFDPDADGTIYAVTVQPDGKILVGGIFSHIGGEARSNLARLDTVTGQADSFDPSANEEVDAFVVLADGRILVGGVFTTIGGQVRNGIARLDGTTGLADGFDPNAMGSVYAIVLQADGKLLVAGTFTRIGGQPRNRIARLHPNTGLADSFNPNANDIVYALAVQADGKVLAAGNFSGANSVGGQTRNHLARLDATTGLADSFDPNASDNVYTLAVQADGRILAGGAFSTLAPNGGGAVARTGLARLKPDGTLDTVFSPNASGTVLFVTVQSDGKILAGGGFTSLAPSGGAAVTRNRIARLERDGRLDRTLNPIDADQLGGQVITTFVQTDGKIIITGDFTTVLGVTRNSIARLNTDGTLDTAFDPNCTGQVTALAVQADGKIVVVGAFLSIGGQARTHIARLDATTGLPDSFSPNANNSFTSVAVQADGKILVGGAFTTIGGQSRTGIARLDATTGMADSFNANVSAFGNVSSIAVQPDGKILAGGIFTSIGGQARTNLARLDASTGLADAFNPNPNGSEVDTMAVQTDGKILVGGVFTTIGGQTRTNLARLDAATGLADSFNPNADNAPLSIAVQADGKILVGGFFATIGGQARNYIARLDATTGLADSFDPNASSLVRSIALQADGKILVGGYFSNIGGQPRALVARLSNDTAALQNLTATPTTVTWARGGASQQFTRVTFELSTNNVNYTPLGNGTPSGSNWSLAGLNLATGQNLYLRARGYYGSGDHNGSQSIQESVRNVFLPPVLKILSITRAANGHILLQCLGFPNQVNNLQASPNLDPGSFAPIVPPPLAADDAGAFPYDDAGAVGLKKRFYRLAPPIAAP